MKNTLLQLFALTICLAANAQNRVDSFDINKSMRLKNSSPNALVAVRDTLYFIASDSFANNQVWAFDKGARFPRPVSKFDATKKLGLGVYNKGLPVIDDIFFLSIMDQTDGNELWLLKKSGGIAQVKDIEPGNTASFPSSLHTHNNILYFNATTRAHGCELWHHIPATNVTERLTDIAPDSASSTPFHITDFNNKIYFNAKDEAHGIELFEYDPATKNTRLVADINPGKDLSNPSNFCTMGGKLYFIATTKDDGTVLWSYDGTTPPQKAGYRSGIESDVANFVQPVAYKNKLYFSGTVHQKFQLKCYDPVTDMSTMVYAINQDINSGGSLVNNLIVYNDILFFTADDGSGMEIWKYDGSGIPSSVTNLSSASQSRTFTNFSATSHELFFSATSNAIGTELFRLSFNKLSIENLSFNAEVTVYPNPTADAAHLQMKFQESQSLTISVTDMSGRTMYTTGNVLYSAATHTVNIPMHNLPAGTYTYHISNAQGSLMNSGKLQKL